MRTASFLRRTTQSPQRCAYRFCRSRPADHSGNLPYPQPQQLSRRCGSVRADNAAKQLGWHSTRLAGSGAGDGNRTHGSSLGSYRHVFDSHQPSRGVPLSSMYCHLPIPTAVTIPDRLSVARSPSEIERATGLEPATFSLGN